MLMSKIKLCQFIMVPKEVNSIVAKLHKYTMYNDNLKILYNFHFLLNLL